MNAKKILILGGTGMLGHTLFTHLSLDKDLDVYATVRNTEGVSQWFPRELIPKVRDGVDANDFDTVIRALASIQPDVIINCIGLIKQLPLASDPLSSINLNTQLPHRISMISRTAHARMIHISTDCVFDGKKGNYTERDDSNAKDLYGRSKFLGEVSYPHCVTLRTSIIGHELKGRYGLVEWFLAQSDSVSGYTKAIFSGFPTLEIARIIKNYVLPNDKLSGVYHISSEPISKYNLLKLIADKYNKNIEIKPSDNVCIDRSLDSSRFHEITGYVSPTWPELIDAMHQNYITSFYYQNMLGNKNGI